MGVQYENATADFTQGPVQVRKDEPKVTDAYVRAMQDNIDRTIKSASAYANKRVQVSKKISGINPRLAYRVVSRASFVPAHPSRFVTRGPGRELKYEYFVIHRPGVVGFMHWFVPGIGAVGRNATLAESVAKATSFCSLKNLMALFRVRETQTATHFLIGLAGELVQMIDLADMAWHVMSLTHPTLGVKINNSNAVGVELEGFVQPYGKIITSLTPEQQAKTKSDFPPAQLQTLAWLLRWFRDNQHYGIPLDKKHIILHSELDPARRTDPGINMDLDNLLGIATSMPTVTSTAKDAYQEPIPIDVADEQAVAQLAGTSVISVGMMEAFQQALVSVVQGAARASKMGAVDRAVYYNAAINHNSVVNAARLMQMAMAQQTETILNSGKLPVQRNRISFNRTTQQWENQP